MNRIIQFASPALMASMAAMPSAQVSVPEIAAGNNTFAFDLYHTVAGSKEGNLFFSPFSISTALAMAYAGAAGSTADEMARVLHFGVQHNAFHQGYGAYLQALEASASDHLQLHIANRLWADHRYELRPEFVALNREAYRSPLQPVDFAHAHEASRITINDWVADRTAQRIKDLIPERAVNEDTRLVLTNAVYFKADWAHPFEAERTRAREFNKQDGSHYETDFMHMQSNFGYLETKAYSTLRLPYAGHKHSMVVVLPHGNTPLAEVEATFAARDLQQALREGNTEVNVAFPKFKTTLPLSLTETLRSMGMNESMAPGANFSDMSPNNDLHISEVIHKAFVETDEKGTEAAAATAVVMMMTSSAIHEPRMPKQFIADRPFLFYIVEDGTGAVLFMGRIMEPLTEG